ncbi:glycoside hydrolase family 3 protein [Microbacterium sp. NIBRBAC000506063]|uniref:glycoside hydrolase family 3 protein n=1 Tax=Microbacterium sp. NIBRBAC000506063 TaxID=2734618 RepID=UPI001CB6FCAB|nr:glycoside hydrolase family 3 C-terminal domain-containing protein [Microbacterium sp. NIBRBAC000506063]
MRHPEVPLGITLPTLHEALAAEFPDAEITFAAGTTIDGGETEGIAEAVAAASAADVVVLALGDRAGLFGRGTSGEGCDAGDLSLPGAQGALLDAVLDSGVPTIVTLLAGRPYALGRAPERAAAIVQSFFAGEEGTGAIAGVLSGRVNPSGRMPVSIPRSPVTHPSTYLAPRWRGGRRCRTSIRRRSTPSATGSATRRSPGPRRPSRRRGSARTAR